MSSSRGLLAILCASALGGCAEEAGRADAWTDPGQPIAGAVALHAGGSPPQGALGALRPAFFASAQPTVTFAFGSAQIDSRARETLAAQASFLRERPEVMVSVTGYADAPGGEVVNLQIGQRRAEAVARALIAQGVAPERILRVATRGDSDMVIETQGRARPNRRVETELSAIGRPARPVAPMDGVRAARVYNDWRSSDPVIEISTTEATQ